jgi:hypothetical protein
VWGGKGNVTPDGLMLNVESGRRQGSKGEKGSGGIFPRTLQKNRRLWSW